MTPEQIALVQSSFAKVEPIAQTAADLFYNRLFELEPGYRSLFPDDISEQKQKLMAMLAVAVKGLGQIEAIVPAVMKLGERHAGYGVTPDQYPTVGSALLWTLDQGLGDDFTPDVEAAWIAAYTVLADTMVAGKDKGSMIAPGSVWLVGAGPGDPDLLTRKAEKLLRSASVVFYDALVGPGVLALVPDDVRLVPVGKRSGRHSKDQDSINDLLVRAALAGERVVRLKGGDPSVFGRSAEEMTELATHGVSVHICPGITAASAAAASASISLTLRGLARKLTLVTAHARAGETLDLEWNALADPKATLAIYMGKAAAKEVSDQLVRSGLAGETPVLVAENVSLPDERLVHTRLDLLPIAANAIGDGPALLLIGEAVRPNGAHGANGASAIRNRQTIRT